MRTERAIRNVVVSLLSYTLFLILGFVTRAYFARLLGAEYLGINGLFSNIISLMSVVELGFGSAVIYNLYRPLSENNTKQIKAIIDFYKRIYRFVACIVLFFGVILTPFIPQIVGYTNIKDNIYIIFVLFIVDSVSSYLLSYKRAIFYADQKEFVITFIHTWVVFCVKLSQIIVLFFLKNYFLFLLIQIISNVAENVVIMILANQQYPYLKNSNSEILNENIREDIIRKVKGLFFHQIGGALVLSTDNIILSMTKNLGIIAVGKYSNYVLLTSTLSSFLGLFFNSITASVGNLIIEKDSEAVYLVYKKVLFLNAALCNFVSVSLLICIEPFISLWIGREFLLPSSLSVYIIINFYIQNMKRTCGLFRNAAGIFYENRFVPIVEVIINLVVSLLLVNIIGISGVVLGTIISSMVHWFYDFPKFLYFGVLKKSVQQYISDFLPYLGTFLVSVFVSEILCYYVRLFDLQLILSLIVHVMIGVLVPNVIFFLVFYRKDEYLYWRSFLLVRLLKKMS